MYRWAKIKSIIFQDPIEKDVSIPPRSILQFEYKCIKQQKYRINNSYTLDVSLRPFSIRGAIKEYDSSTFYFTIRKLNQ